MSGWVDLHFFRITLNYHFTGFPYLLTMFRRMSGSVDLKKCFSHISLSTFNLSFNCFRRAVFLTFSEKTRVFPKVLRKSTFLRITIGDDFRVPTMTAQRSRDRRKLGFDGGCCSLWVDAGTTIQTRVVTSMWVLEVRKQQRFRFTVSDRIQFFGCKSA